MFSLKPLLLVVCALAAVSCDMREPDSTAPLMFTPSFSFSTYALGGGPFGSVVPVGGTAWIAQSTNGTLRKMNVASGTFSSTITVGPAGDILPFNVAANAAGTRLYVAAFDETVNDQGLVASVDPATLNLVDQLRLTGDASNLIAMPTGDIVYVGMTDGPVYKIALANGTGSILATASLPTSAGYHFAFNQDRSVLYASSRDGGIFKLDPNSLSQLGSFPATYQSQGMVFSADWTKLYVAAEAGDILVLNPATLTQVSTITTGCRGLSLVLVNGLLYDSCTLDGKVVVVDPVTNTIVSTENVTGYPRELSYDPTSGKIVAPNEFGWVDRIDQPSPPPPPAGKYVAPPPQGSSSHSGTIDSPWDLRTGLTSSQVTPGTTVWIRGGTYGPDTDILTTLAGTSSSPILVKQYPGEHAIIDGRIQIDGSNLQFWGLELMMSNPMSHATAGWKAIEVYHNAAGIKLVNLVIHDAGGSGLIYYWPGGNVEMHGSILYNNGSGPNRHSHGIYMQNSAGHGTVRLAGSVVFDNQSYGVHAFSDNTPGSAFPLANINVANNIFFNNGTISPNGPASNILMASDGIAGATNLNATGNVSYWSASLGLQGTGITMGYSTAEGGAMTALSNILLGGKRGLTINLWQTATVTDNVAGGPSSPQIQPDIPVDLRDPSLTGYTWRNNTYYYTNLNTSRWIAYYQTSPQGAFVPLSTFLSVTQFNQFTPNDQVTGTLYGLNYGLTQNEADPSRAFLWIYNKDGLPNVTVSLSSFLSSCSTYKIYNVQDPFGAVKATGSCPAGNVLLPMDDVSPPTPLDPTGTRGATTPPRTGPYFQVFWVQKS